MNKYVCEDDVLQAVGDRGEVYFRRSNRTFYSSLSYSGTCSMLCSGLKNSWFAVGSQCQGWDRLVRSESVDCASASVEICFTTAKGIPGSFSSVTEHTVLQKKTQKTK